MTNREKINELGGVLLEPEGSDSDKYFLMVSEKWLDSEYKESDHIAETSEMVEPTTKKDLDVDCISRESVLKLIYDYKENHSNDREHYPINYGTLLDMIRWVRNLPSVTPQSCEDAISRQALLNATVNKNSIWNKTTDSKGENLETIISKLPPVTPQERKGHWIDEGIYAEGQSYHSFMCSECGWHFIENKSELVDFKYCPFCRADMRGEEV